MNVDVFSYRISSDLADVGASNAKQMINTINPHSFCIAQEDARFKAALNRSDILLPDGIGIVWAAKVLKGIRLQKIAGADLHAYCLQLAHKTGKRVFYLGAAPSTLEKIKERLEIEYPGLKAGFYSPPYKTEFSEEDNQKMINEVNGFQPDFLFVGMTAPKQEKWIYEHFDQLHVGTTCAIGAVFDFYAGTVQRAPSWMIKLGLEWLHRSLKSWRLAKRNLSSNPRFVFAVIKEKYFKS